tara:strand:+ start:6834 stop:7979 length:1146 start_codon:yes stop_codon:yes gene_type:complete
MQNLTIKFLGILALTFCSLAWTQDSGPMVDSDKLVEPTKDQQRWGALPAAALKTETGLQLGGLLIYYLPKQNSTDNGSSITSAALYSAKHQARIVSSPTIYFDNNKQNYQGSIDFKLWPSRFYGIGSEPEFLDIPDQEEEGILYKSTNISIDNNYSRSPDGKFWYGVGHKYKYEALTWDEQEQILDSTNTTKKTGFLGGVESGFGVVFSYDTRDNINSARKGYFAQISNYTYKPAFGSDFEYTHSQLDLRYFLNLPGKRVIAVRALQAIQNGDIPIQNLASTDGIHELRGVSEGYYHDKQLSAYQIEYRGTPMPWKFGYRVFADAGQVRSDFNEWDSKAFKVTYGFGIRWALNPERRYNVRIDLPIVDGALSPVIQIKEAF